jgi:hypothetical protein
VADIPTVCAIGPLAAKWEEGERAEHDEGADPRDRITRHVDLGHRRLNAFHQPTIDYVTRRTAEGKTRAKIMRCLKRFLAREI